MKKIFLSLFILALLAGCAAPAPTGAPIETYYLSPTPAETGIVVAVTHDLDPLPTATGDRPVAPTPAAPTITPTETPAPTEPAAPTPTPIPDTREAPERWQSWPVVPPVTQRAVEIYRLGRELGRDPQRFSKIGDCQGIREVLMGLYDVPGVYSFSAADADLKIAVSWFRGSFNRNGMALMGGFNALAVLDPARANPDYCLPGETPIACEFRIHNPSFVIISLEFWYTNRNPENYTAAMREIIEYSMENGVVPILATKADNSEGDHSINLATARLAYEYNLPLWNFWRAVQPLPYHGLDPNRDDGFHIAYDTWATRALTALQALNSVWMGVSIAQGERIVVPVETQDLASLPTPTPDGVQATPDGVQATPDGVQATPDGVQATPDGVQATPDGVQATPMAGSGGFVFGVRARDGGAVQARGVYYYDYSSGSLIQLAGEGYDFQSLSPDGNYALLSRGGDLYYTPVDGGQLTALTDGLLVESRRAALWLEDGAIAVLAARGEEQAALWHLSPDGQTWTRLAGAEIRPAALLPSFRLRGVLVEQGDCLPGTGCSNEGAVWVGLDGAVDNSLAGVVRPAFSRRGEYFLYTYYNHLGKSALGLTTLNRDWQWNLDLPEMVLADYDWSHDGKEAVALFYNRSDYSGKISQNTLVLIQPYAYPDITTRDLPAAPLGLAAQLRWSPDRTRVLMPYTEPLQDGRFRLRLQVYNWYGESFAYLDEGDWIDADFIYVGNIAWR